METETLLRILAIIVAAIVVSTSLDFSWAITKIKALFKRKESPEQKREVSFLEIVESWHVLRNQCENYGLEEAVNKIDEVFPLLNVEE
jgi:hypothetical protein